MHVTCIICMHVTDNAVRHAKNLLSRFSNV